LVIGLSESSFNLFWGKELSLFSRNLALIQLIAKLKRLEETETDTIRGITNLRNLLFLVIISIIRLCLAIN
jgi:hypothetical protein